MLKKDRRPTKIYPGRRPAAGNALVDPKPPENNKKNDPPPSIL